MVEVVDSGGGAQRTATLTEPVVNLDLHERIRGARDHQGLLGEPG
jgi:hypothetical protein